MGNAEAPEEVDDKNCILRSEAAADTWIGEGCLSKHAVEDKNQHIKVE